MALLQALSAFLLVAFVVILVHELGHLWAAKLCGVRVRTFSIGFGPRLVGFRLGETDYRLSLLPLGGFVDVAGMSEEERADPRGFQQQGIAARLFIVLAGAAMNLLLAFALIAGLAAAHGYAEEPSVIERVHPSLLPEGAAQWAQLPVDAHVVAVAGRGVSSWTDMQYRLVTAAGDAVSVRLADGSEHTMPLPESMEERRALVETFNPRIAEYQEGTLAGGARYGASETISLTALTVDGVSGIATGRISLRHLTGPIGVALLAAETLLSGWGVFLMFLAVISINLAVINLLPVPGLDGGLAALVGLEAVRGRPLGPVAARLALAAGVVFIALICIIAITNDVLGLIG
jgi:regulator of sigma E protease